MTATTRILGLDVTEAEWTLVALEVADPAAVRPVARVSVPAPDPTGSGRDFEEALWLALERIRPLLEGGDHA